MSLTLERVRELLDYDPDTGLLTWKIKPRRRRLISSYAGTLNPSGYIQVCIDQVIYKGHRIAWFYHYGKWPTGEIDHADGVRNNNRINNLRLSSRSTNQANAKKRTGSKTPYKGVVRISGGRKKPWMARICVNRRTVGLGYFLTPEEAHGAYLEAADKHFGEFARSR